MKKYYSFQKMVFVSFFILLMTQFAHAQSMLPARVYLENGVAFDASFESRNVRLVVLFEQQRLDIPLDQVREIEILQVARGERVSGGLRSRPEYRAIVSARLTTRAGVVQEVQLIQRCDFVVNRTNPLTLVSDRQYISFPSAFGDNRCSFRTSPADFAYVNRIVFE